MHRDDAKVRIEPFDAIELDLADLWAELAAPPPRRGRAGRASEPMAAYGGGSLDDYFEDAP